MKFRTYAAKTVKYKIPLTHDMEITLPKSYSTWREKINYHMSRLALNLFSFFGGKRKHANQEWGDAISFIEVDTDKILDGLFRIIKGLDRLTQPCMIIVGNDSMHEIMNIPLDAPGFGFIAQTRVNVPEYTKYGISHIAYYLDIPIYYVPNFQGVAVVPDFKDNWCMTRVA